MENSNGLKEPNFADDIRKIRILSFSSYKKALLYSGKITEKFDNWNLAKTFAEANGMVPIETTEGGKYLSVPDRGAINYSQHQITRVWDRASVKYCLNIEGAIKTFICGTWRGSTFRRKEIQTLLRSKHVESINGRDHADYVRLRRAVQARLNDEKRLPQNMRHQFVMNAVFRRIAFAEIRQDAQAAREQGKLQELPSILARVGHLRDQHRRELRAMPRTPELQRLSEMLSAREEMAQANPGLHLVMPVYAHG